jgi:hypothetical protein
MAVLLLLGLAIRLDHVKNPIIDHISFRQGTEAMMARHFHRNGIEIQYPQIMGYSAGPRLWVNEFPLYPATMACLYKLTGERVAVGRLISIFFSLATAVVCFLILRISFTNTVPYWSVFLFLLSPMGAYTGRCVIRHPMAFFFQALLFLFWLIWLKKPSRLAWTGTWLAGALTILMNFANAYIGLPMAVALGMVRGWKGFLDKRVYVLVISVFAPPMLWLKHSLEPGYGGFFLAASAGQIKQRDLERFLRLEWLNETFFTNLWRWSIDLLLTPAGIALGVLGLCILWRSKMAWLVRIWMVTALLYVCIDHYPFYLNPHDYYITHLLIPACLAGGIGAGTLVEWAKRAVPKYPVFSGNVATVLVGLITLYSWQAYYFPMRNRFLTDDDPLVSEIGWHQHWIKAAEKVREVTEPDSVMVLDRAEDTLIYYCDRPGWVNHWEGLTEVSIRSQISNGADYLLITRFKMEGSEFTGYHFDDPPPMGSPGAPWVRANCPIVHDGLIYQIVDLAPEKHGRARPTAEGGPPKSG